MSLYRLYIDEVGNHDMGSADNPNERFLSLTGVFLESEYVSNILLPEMDSLKKKYFQHDPDEPVIFHRKEMVNQKYPFHVLRDEQTRLRFDDELLASLLRWEYKVITIVVDKKEHRDRYSTWRFHPYHYCLEVMLERFVLFLYYNNKRGDVMVESRGGKEDEKLKNSYRRLYKIGTDNVSIEKFQCYLTSKELKVKPKKMNIAGLQLADMIAYPSRNEILVANSLRIDKCDNFGAKIILILQEQKYLRSIEGKIDGFGRKILP